MSASTVEGMLATWWLNLVTGAIPQGFALYLGATPFIIGLLGSVQAAAALASLPGAFSVERRSERRLFTTWTAGAARIMWLIPAAAALFLPRSVALATLLIVVGVSWALVNFSIPAWTSWMNDMIPERMRGRYFSRRSLIIGLSSLVVAPLAGRFLDVGKASFGPKWAFAILFGAAGILGIANTIALYIQPEPPVARAIKPRRLDLEYFRAPLRDKPFARFLWAFAAWAFSQSVAGPFFAVYMLEKLNFTFFEVQMVNALAAMVTLMVMPSVGYLVDKYGNAALYKIAYYVVTFIPLFWVATRTDRPWLTAVSIVIAQVLSGLCGAALGISQFNLLLGSAPAGQTARYSAVWSTVVGAAGFIGPLIGGIIADATQNVEFHAGGWLIGAYKITFIVSTLLRWAVIPLLSGITERESAGVREVIGRVAASKPLQSVRHLRRLRGHSAPDARAESVQALGRLRERLAFEELVEAMGDPVLAVRRQAAIALGELRDERAVEPLLAALADDSAGTRTQAAVALGKLGDERAVDALIAVLQEEGGHDPAFVQAAAQALGHLRARRAAQPLLDIAEEAENPARAAAIQSLGDLGIASTAEPLTEMLRHDANLEPREVSALGDALAKLGEDSAVIPLLERVQDAESPLLRRELTHHAAMLIGGGEELYSWLALDELDREAAIAGTLNGHARDLRKEGRLSSALRAEAAVAAMTAAAPELAVRHLLYSVRKSGGHVEGPALDAITWLARRQRPLMPEELLLAAYAYHSAMSKRGAA
ncbi:MAG TPA: MFS transporter [Armatimonadota bacterium]